MIDTLQRQTTPMDVQCSLMDISKHFPSPSTTAGLPSVNALRTQLAMLLKNSRYMTTHMQTNALLTDPDLLSKSAYSPGLAQLIYVSAFGDDKTKHSTFHEITATLYTYLSFPHPLLSQEHLMTRVISEDDLYEKFKDQSTQISKDHPEDERSTTSITNLAERFSKLTRDFYQKTDIIAPQLVSLLEEIKDELTLQRVESGASSTTLMKLFTKGSLLLEGYFEKKIYNEDIKDQQKKSDDLLESLGNLLKNNTTPEPSKKSDPNTTAADQKKPPTDAALNDSDIQAIRHQLAKFPAKESIPCLDTTTLSELTETLQNSLTQLRTRKAPKLKKALNTNLALLNTEQLDRQSVKERCQTIWFCTMEHRSGDHRNDILNLVAGDESLEHLLGWTYREHTVDQTVHYGGGAQAGLYYELTTKNKLSPQTHLKKVQDLVQFSTDLLSNSSPPLKERHRIFLSEFRDDCLRVLAEVTKLNKKEFRNWRYKTYRPKTSK